MRSSSAGRAGDTGLTLPQRFSLGLLAMMASGPFLLPFSLHRYPVPTFWSEWLAAVLGLAAAMIGLVPAASKSLRLPPSLGMPAVVLLALLAQFALGRLVFPQIGLLYASYLLWAALLLLLGRHLATELGLARLCDVLAAALCGGALVAALLALAPLLGLGAYVPWFLQSPPKGLAYSNLGQANHFAVYAWLGVVSTFYLRGRGKLPRPLLWLVVSITVLAGALGSSRSTFVYPLVLLGALAWTQWRLQGTDLPRGLWRDAAFMAVLVVALGLFGGSVLAWMQELFARLPADVAGVDGATRVAGARLYDAASTPSARLAIARTAWSVFVDQPWLGQGAGNFAWASFSANAASEGAMALQTSENAHNFVLQGLAEFGAPATIAVLLLLAFWARGFLAQPWRFEHFWCAAVLGIGAVHSLTEYPLWYAYFLGPAALLLGACDVGRGLALAGRRVAIYLLLLGLFGIVILVRTGQDYVALEAASNRPLAAHAERDQAWRISMNTLAQLHRESLLSPLALLALTTLTEPGHAVAADRAALCEKGIRVSPGREVVTRCAMHLALAGRSGDAAEMTLAVLHAYPAERSATAAELASAAKTYPELRILWLMSIAK